MRSSYFSEDNDDDEDISIEEMFKENQTSFLIHFDDAVSVLRNLTQAQSSSKHMFTINDVNDIVDRKI